jgi:cell division initiation protein
VEKGLPGPLARGISERASERRRAMKITPLDVGRHRFPMKWRGYDPREVEIFLEMVAQEMEELVHENKYLTEDMKRKNAELAEHKEKERLLKDAMVSAQKMAREMKAKMLKEAQVVIAEAEVEADQAVQRALNRVTEIKDEIRELKEDRIRAREELRSLINTYKSLLEAGEEEEKSEESTEIESVLCLMPRRRIKSAGD